MLFSKSIVQEPPAATATQLVDHFGSFDAYQDALCKARIFGVRPALPNGWDWDDIINSYFVPQRGVLWLFTSGSIKLDAHGFIKATLPE